MGGEDGGKNNVLLNEHERTLKGGFTLEETQ